MCGAVVTEDIALFHSPPRYLTSAGHLSTEEAEQDTPSWKLIQGSIFLHLTTMLSRPRDFLFTASLPISKVMPTLAGYNCEPKHSWFF